MFVAERAVAKVNIGGKAVYFVVIHCTKWKGDEGDNPLERANSIKKILDDLKGSADLKNEKIIIGIDTNTGHIQNLGNAKNIPAESGAPATNDTQQNWRIIARKLLMKMMKRRMVCLQIVIYSNFSKQEKSIRKQKI